jgi:hypothetical protein
MDRTSLKGEQLMVRRDFKYDYFTESLMEKIINDYYDV